MVEKHQVKESSRWGSYEYRNQKHFYIYTYPDSHVLFYRGIKYGESKPAPRSLVITGKEPSLTNRRRYACISHQHQQKSERPVLQPRSVKTPSCGPDDPQAYFSFPFHSSNVCSLLGASFSAYCPWAVDGSISASSPAGRASHHH